MSSDKEQPSAGNSIQTITLSVMLTVMCGWLLYIGQSILLPIFIAVIAVYVLSLATEALGRWPFFRMLPRRLRGLIVLLIFVAAVCALVWFTASTVDHVVERAPSYQENLEVLAGQLFGGTGLNENPDWKAIRAATIGEFDLQSVFRAVLSSAGSLAGLVMTVVIYAMFLLAERDSFSQKISAALPDRGNAEQTHALIKEINQRIGEYLTIKTLINVILGALSFVILWLFGVEFALFWAVLIGLLNYIPYVGSLLGVVFPVLLTIAQFGSLQTTLLVAAMLTVAQMWVGNFLEPRMIGNQVNLSPFVVLVSLAVWSSLWGVAGAILAIPMTSILAIILGAFKSTRPFAILLAQDIPSFTEE